MVGDKIECLPAAESPVSRMSGFPCSSHENSHVPAEQSDQQSLRKPNHNGCKTKLALTAAVPSINIHLRWDCDRRLGPSKAG